MWQKLLNVLIKFLTKVIDILLAPLNTLIATMLPDLTTALAKVNQFFDLLGDYGSFAMSYLGISNETLSIIILLYTLILTIPLAAHTFKLIIKWWHAIV